MVTYDTVYVVYCRAEIYGCHESEWAARDHVECALAYDATPEQRAVFKIVQYSLAEEIDVAHS